MPRQLFRDWRPDLSKLANSSGCVVANDCVPIASGFGPRPGFLDGGFTTAATEAVTSGFSIRDNSRNPNNFAGGATKLFHAKNDVADVSRAAGYTTGNERWTFSYFGNKVYASNYTDPLQSFELQTSSLFEDVAGDYVPRGRHLAVSGSFLVVGNYQDPITGAVPNGIGWSSLGNGSDWPEPGSDEALAKQSDRQPLEGDGGWVQAVVAGSEVTSIFQEKAIWRMDYRGGQTVFALNRVEPAHGCLIPGLAVAFKREVFFLSEDGFRIFDYTQSRPAGKERYDQAFLADVDTSYFNRVTAIRDPDTTRIWVSYAGAGNTAGTPNRLLIYDYELDRATTGDEALECLALTLPKSTGTLDDPPPEDIDATSGSFDDETTIAGAYALGGWDTSHKLGSMEGTNADARFTTGWLEMAPGQHARIVAVRPLINGSVGTTTRIASMEQTDDEEVFGKPVPLTRLGSCPHRVDGRYHQVQTDVKGSNFVDALGLDIDMIPTGSR
jgi:hypothetical protein